jgi:hypothetical protein
MKRRHFVTLVAAALAAACAQGTSTARQQSTGMHNLITQEELSRSTERTLYDAIQHLRPTFYRSRQVRTNSTPNPEPVHVFIDGTRAEGLETLKQFSPGMVQEVRFYEPQDANIRFGTGHHGGLIAVTMVK